MPAFEQYRDILRHEELLDSYDEQREELDWWDTGGEPEVDSSQGTEEDALDPTARSGLSLGGMGDGDDPCSTKEMMQPCPLYPHLISLVGQVMAMTPTRATRCPTRRPRAHGPRGGGR